MFFQSVFLEFLKFVAFYVILKALILFIHVEFRRSGVDSATALSGLLS